MFDTVQCYLEIMTPLNNKEMTLLNNKEMMHI